MTSLLYPLWPELVLVAVACGLFLLGAVPTVAARRAVPIVALLALLLVLVGLLYGNPANSEDASHTVFVDHIAIYIKLLSAAVGVLFVFLNWPTNAEATGNSALDVGGEVGEFFGLMLLAIAGIFLVASANDIMLLFLGIELASIPTYIMVSISRPLPVAQEAGVKYFFLGAMAAALMLFGFSYLYGTTGSTSLIEIRQNFHPGVGPGRSAWQLLAVVMLVLGVAFKLAAVPLHTYAGDVYQGAATPVTALLAFVPKTAGLIAMLKILAVASAPHWSSAPPELIKLLWIIAVLTMTFGNVLALMQANLKRVLAYSSVAHSGYILTALTALIATRGIGNAAAVEAKAIAGVLFYITAYGIMNTGAFGVLMMLPGRTDKYGRHDQDGHPLPTAGSAETFEDIAGMGRRYPGLCLAMAVCAFSLTGLPLTIGFIGKVMLILPAFEIIRQPLGHPYASLMLWLVVITMLNAAISAGYYLKIVAFMFLRPEHSEVPSHGGIVRSPAPLFPSWAVMTAIVLSVGGTLYYGMFFPATGRLAQHVTAAAQDGLTATDAPAVVESPAAVPAPLPQATSLAVHADAR